MNMEKTFGSMVEELKSTPNQYLNVTPPLRLKELGDHRASLVLLSKGTALNHNPDYFWLCYELNWVGSDFFMETRLPEGNQWFWKCENVSVGMDELWPK